MSSTVKYSKLPMADPGDRDGESTSVTIFDYSSPFTYENREDTKWKYRSAFTYDSKNLTVVSNNTSKSQLVGDNWARFLVMFGFLVVYTFTFPILIWFSFKKIKENERFVVFRLGKCQGSKGPGLVFMLPMLDRYHKINIHLKAFSVPPKQVITSDGAIIEVGAEIYHQVIDAERSVKNVQDLNHSTRILVQSALCNILSDKTLAEIEAERKVIQDILLETSNKTCSSWGVEIQRAELSQIKVLSSPPPKATPTLMMPPGLLEMSTATAAGGVPEGLPSVFMQLASAVMSASQGDENQGESIADAMAAFQKMRNENDDDTEPQSQEVEKSNEQTDVTQTCLDANQVNSTTGPVDADQLVSLIRGCLDESLVQKVQATFQFDIHGEDGGQFFLDLSHGCGSIERGRIPLGQPDVEVVTTAEDLRTMLAGNLSPFHAYMSGRLQLKGDVKVALKLEELAEKLKPQLSSC